MDQNRALITSGALASDRLAVGADLAALVDEWSLGLDLQVAAGEIAASTAVAYKRGAGRVLRWAVGQGLGRLTPDDVRRWRAHELAQGNKPASLNTWIAGLRALCAWMVASGRSLANPCDGIKGEKRKGTTTAHQREGLTPEEVRRLLALPDVDNPAGRRDLAILALMVYTGVRSVEVQRANVEDLKTREGRLTLNVHGKGRAGADQFVVLAHSAAAGAVYDWLAMRGADHGPLFVALGNRHSATGRLSMRALRGLVKRYFHAAGIMQDTKTTHSLRHTAITAAIRKGAKPTAVQAMARHASLNTTMIYYHEQERLTSPAEGFIDYGES